MVSLLLTAILTFIGNTTFHENNQISSSSSCVGAIWASASFLQLNGTNNFVNTAEGSSGGAIYTQTKTSLRFTGMNTFSHNSAFRGGAINTVESGTLVFNGSNSFINNSANWNGGAIYAKSSTWYEFIGTSSFSFNSADNQGGAIYTKYDVVLTFSGTNNSFNNLLHNSQDISSYGGAIYATTNISLSFGGTTNFSHNFAECGGAIYADDLHYNVVLTFTGSNNFTNNSAFIGGVIYARGGGFNSPGNVVLTFNGTNNFISNAAHYAGGASSKGGAIHAEVNTFFSFSGDSNFIQNTARSGGAIYLDHHAVFAFNGINNFFNNLAIYKHGGAILGPRLPFFIFEDRGCGGAIFTYGVCILSGSNNFIGNSANGNGGAIFAVFSRPLNFTGNSSFYNNSAVQGGAIFANYERKLTFSAYGNISFMNNGHITTDSCGGAMYLTNSSTIIILPQTTVHWEKNHANLGGAIYVVDANPLTSYCNETLKLDLPVPKEKCFFQLPDKTFWGVDNIRLVFKNNSANTAGSMLYGGTIDNCKLITRDNSSWRSKWVFHMLVDYQADNTNSSISSDPFRIRPCENNHPDWDMSDKTLSIYPGETFRVSVVSTGQRNGIVPTEVRSHLSKGKLVSSQYVQQVTTMCTTLNYTVFSQQNVTLKFYADGPCSTFGEAFVLKLNINQTCPPGFNINQEESACVCDLALQKYTNRCNITNGLGQITRESDDTFWVGYDGTLTVHPYCPFDYCANGRVVFPLNNTDIQCATTDPASCVELAKMNNVMIVWLATVQGIV